jgi:Asp-tRNA(Asn)/Glu-tRNA(Gln) amidotransferase A subunit family amidase
MNSLACIKPSRHVIDRSGLWPLSESLDTIGVMARNTADLASVMQAYEPHIDYQIIINDSVKNMKVGVDFDLINQVAKKFPELKYNFNNTIDIYKKLGVQIIPINIPVVIMDKLAENARTTISIDAHKNYTNFTQSDLNNINTQLQNLIKDGNQKADNNDIVQQFNEIWQEIYNENNLDAVLLFVWGVPAPLKSEIPKIITSPDLFAAAVRYMVPFNYFDLPLVVVPQKTPSKECINVENLCSYNNRPSSFQLIGSVNQYSAAKLLRLAYAYEKERGELIYPFMEIYNK